MHMSSKPTQTMDEWEGDSVYDADNEQSGDRFQTAGLGNKINTKNQNKNECVTEVVEQLWDEEECGWDTQTNEGEVVTEGYEEWDETKVGVETQTQQGTKRMSQGNNDESSGSQKKYHTGHTASLMGADDGDGQSRHSLPTVHESDDEYFKKYNVWNGDDEQWVHSGDHDEISAEMEIIDMTKEIKGTQTTVATALQRHGEPRQQTLHFGNSATRIQAQTTARWKDTTPERGTDNDTEQGAQEKGPLTDSFMKIWATTTTLRHDLSQLDQQGPSEDVSQPVTLQECLRAQMDYAKENTLWPKGDIRQAYAHLPGDISVRTAQGGIGKEAIWDPVERGRVIEKGYIIGIYPGLIRRNTNGIAVEDKQYVLATESHDECQVGIDGDPNRMKASSWSVYTRINGTLWPDDVANVQYGANGLMMASRQIVPKDVLRSDYRESYDWIHTTAQRIPLILDSITRAAGFLQVPVLDDGLSRLREEWSGATTTIVAERREGSGLQRLLLLCVEGQLGKLNQLHCHVPNWNHNFNEWLEKLLRCTVFYASVALGEVEGKRGVLLTDKQAYSATNRDTGERFSERLNKTPRTYDEGWGKKTSLTDGEIEYEYQNKKAPVDSRGRLSPLPEAHTEDTIGKRLENFLPIERRGMSGMEGNCWLIEGLYRLELGETAVTDTTYLSTDTDIEAVRNQLKLTALEEHYGCITYCLDGGEMKRLHPTLRYHSTYIPENIVDYLRQGSWKTQSISGILVDTEAKSGTVGAKIEGIIALIEYLSKPKTDWEDGFQVLLQGHDMCPEGWEGELGALPSEYACLWMAIARLDTLRWQFSWSQPTNTRPLQNPYQAMLHNLQLHNLDERTQYWTRAGTHRSDNIGVFGLHYRHPSEAELAREIERNEILWAMQDGIHGIKDPENDTWDHGSDTHDSEGDNTESQASTDAKDIKLAETCFDDAKYLRAMTWNVNGLSQEYKIQEIVKLIKRTNVDIFTLVDTRKGKPTGEYIRKLLRFENMAYKVLCFEPLMTKDGKHGVGGQIVILSAQIGNIHSDHLVEGGGLVEITCTYAEKTKMKLLSSYLPCPNTMEGSLDSMLRTAMGDGKPAEGIKARVSQSVVKAQVEGRIVLWSGDFNSDINTSDRHKISKFLKENYFRDINSDSSIRIPSYKNARTRSRLDYIVPAQEGIEQIWCEPVALSFQSGDHRPIAGVFRIDGVPTPHSITTRLLQSDIQLQEGPKRERFEKALAEIVDSLVMMEDDETFLYQAAVRTAGLVKKKRKRKPPPQSIETRTMLLALNSLVTLQRRLNGNTGFSRWKDHMIEDKVRNWVRVWSKERTCITAESDDEVVTHEFDLAFWINIHIEDIPIYLPVALLSATLALATRMKSEAKKRRDDYIKQRDEEVIVGKIGRAIASISEKQFTSFDMESLRTKTGVITDGEEIHRRGTNHFAGWFRAPEAGFEDDGSPFDDSKWTCSESEFIALHSKSGVPENWLQCMWKALQSEVTATQQAQIETSLEATITFQDYKESVESCPHDSAGGRTGLTYNMIRLWPEAMHRRAYKAMISMWELKQIPTHWKAVWLVPIPKVPDPTLDELRPLMLFEALRKVWMRIVARRIQKTLGDLGLLETAQDGSLAGKTIDTTNIGFINAMETAKEVGTHCYGSSMDIQKAFDSGMKNFILYSWKRKGIPIAIREYIVALDVGADVLLRTPWALQQVRNGKHIKGFSPTRGTGQGDVISPLAWIVMFDIPLKMLRVARENNRDAFRTSDINGHLHRYTDFAFVDDLVFFAATQEGLQLMTDVFCAWSCVVDIRLAIHKLRLFAANWGPGDTITGDTLIVHTSGWIAQEVKMMRHGAVKYVGVVHDLSLDNTTQRELTMQELRKALAVVSSKKAAAGTLIMVIRRSVIPSILYRIRACAWPLKWYQDIDKMIQAAYRRILKHMRSAPTAILYMTDGLGAGLDDVTRLSQSAKMAMLDRLDKGTERDRVSGGGALARAAQEVGSRVIPHQETPIWIAKGSTRGRIYWVTSLLEYLKTLDRHIVIGGREPDLQNRLIIDYLAVQGRCTEIVTKLNGMGIATVGELVMEGDGQSELTDIASSIGILLVARGPLQICRGQIWTTFRDRTKGICYEIMGFVRDGMEVVRWRTQSCSDMLRVDCIVTLQLRSGRNTIRGAGSRVTIPMDRLPRFTLLVTLGTEIQKGYNTRATIIAIRNRTARIQPCDFIDDRTELGIWLEDAVTIHLSSATRDRRSLADRLRGAHDTVTIVTIVKTYGRNRWEAISLHFSHLDTVDHSWANIVAYAAVVKFGPEQATYHTTSTAAFKSVSECGQWKWKHDHRTSILGGLRKHTKQCYLAKRFEGKESWCATDVADRVIKGQDDVRYSILTLESHRIINGYIYARALARHSTLSIFTRTRVDACSLRVTSANKWSTDYVINRDVHRSKHHIPLPAIWVNRGMKLSAAIAQQLTKNTGDLAGLDRLIWDKHWLGCVESKQTGTESMAMCLNSVHGSNCGVKETRDHVVLRCQHPDTVNRRQSAMAEVARLLLASRGVERDVLRTYVSTIEAGDTVEQWLGIVSPATMAALDVVARGTTCDSTIWNALVALAKVYFECVVDIMRAYLHGTPIKQREAQRQLRLQRPKKTVPQHPTHEETRRFQAFFDGDDEEDFNDGNEDQNQHRQDDGIHANGRDDSNGNTRQLSRKDPSQDTRKKIETIALAASMASFLGIQKNVKCQQKVPAKSTNRRRRETPQSPEMHKDGNHITRGTRRELMDEHQHQQSHLNTASHGQKGNEYLLTPTYWSDPEPGTHTANTAGEPTTEPAIDNYQWKSTRLHTATALGRSSELASKLAVARLSVVDVEEEEWRDIHDVNKGNRDTPSKDASVPSSRTDRSQRHQNFPSGLDPGGTGKHSVSHSTINSSDMVDLPAFHELLNWECTGKPSNNDDGIISASSNTDRESRLDGFDTAHQTNTNNSITDGGSSKDDAPMTNPAITAPTGTSSVLASGSYKQHQHQLTRLGSSGAVGSNEINISINIDNSSDSKLILPVACVSLQIQMRYSTSVINTSISHTYRENPQDGFYAVDTNSCSIIRKSFPQLLDTLEEEIENNHNSNTPMTHQVTVENRKRNKERSEEDKEPDVYKNLLSSPPAVETKLEITDGSELGPPGKNGSKKVRAKNPPSFSFLGLHG